MGKLRLMWLNEIVSGHWEKISIDRRYFEIKNLDDALKQLENIEVFYTPEQVEELLNKIFKF